MFTIDTDCLSAAHPEYTDVQWSRLLKGGTRQDRTVVFQGKEPTFLMRPNLFMPCLQSSIAVPQPLPEGVPSEVRNIRAIPDPKDWLAWARYVGKLRKQGERGVGDTVRRILGKGGEWFKRWYKLKTGEDCNCARRQSAWNIMYPYTENFGVRP